MPELSLIKMKITRDMVGSECFFPELYNPEVFMKVSPGEIINCNIDKIPDKYRRSYSQLGLYWKACQVVSENLEDNAWSTQKKVDEQVKLAAHFVDLDLSFIHEFENKKTGKKESRLHVVTSSIAFKNLKHIDACGFFEEAFEIMATKLGVCREDLVASVKERMG